MKFDLVDRVLSLADDRIVTLKHVSSAEEYLQDHFPTFPVLPGVMMLEALVQAGRLLVEALPDHADDRPLVLGRVRALKYGAFAKPGATLRVEVELLKRLEAGAFDLRGEAFLLEPPTPATLATPAPSPDTPAPIAASGRFTLRPLRLHART